MKTFIRSLSLNVAQTAAKHLENMPTLLTKYIKNVHFHRCSRLNANQSSESMEMIMIIVYVFVSSPKT